METSSECDRMFLQGLFLAVKHISPLDNMTSELGYKNPFDENLTRLPATGAQLIAYPSISSASPALNENSGKSQISLVDYYF
jgi:hypothetical protein